MPRWPQKSYDPADSDDDAEAINEPAVAVEEVLPVELPGAVAVAAVDLEAATAVLLVALTHADQEVRSAPGYDGSRYGGLVGDYVLGRIGPRLGVTQSPRRSVPSLVAAVADLG